MSTLRMVLIAAVVIGSTAYTGLLFGRVSSRWGVDKEIALAGEKVSQLPEKFADWEVVSSEQLPPRTKQLLLCAGDFIRKFENKSTGNQITAAIIVGPSGPLSVHDPDVCYTGSGFRVVQAPAKETFTVGDKQVELWTTVMNPQEGAGGQIKVLWAWFDGQKWSTPDFARFAFVGTKYLYKLQIVVPIDPLRGVERSGINEFVGDFFPVLEQALTKDGKRD